MQHSNRYMYIDLHSSTSRRYLAGGGKAAIFRKSGALEINMNYDPALPIPVECRQLLRERIGGPSGVNFLMGISELSKTKVREVSINSKLHAFAAAVTWGT